MTKKLKKLKVVPKKKAKVLLPEKKPKIPAKVSPEVLKSSSIASYYGFQNLPEISIEKEDLTLSKKFTESHLKSLHPFKDKKDRYGGFLEEKISILRHFSEKKFSDLNFPIMGYYKGPLVGNPHMKRNIEEETFNLEIIGVSKSIAEATIIETSMIILKDRYPDEDLYVEINNVGDKDAIGKFGKELLNYCKKESHKFNKPCKEAIKKDVFALFTCDHDVCKPYQENAPKPMSFLGESHRSHFKEVLEYLETLKIPYHINHCLIGSKSYCSETIFEIKGRKKVLAKVPKKSHLEDDKNNHEEIEQTFAIGERYGHLAKKVWGKKDVPAIGVALLIHPHFVLNKKIYAKEKQETSKFFFIQFGFDAKLKSLSLIEMLRQSKINVEQSLSKDKLTVQLAVAEKMEIPYVIIMGQKEAMENSVVVRNMNTRSQETVLHSELVGYLKKLK